MSPRMRRSAAILITLASLVLAGARPRAVRVPPLPLPPQDVFSFAEPARITVSHLSLDLNVDFDQRRLNGSATLFLRNHSETTSLKLDTLGLDIEAVTLDDGSAAAFELGEPSPIGAPLTVAISPGTRSVTIRYATRPDASGLHWYTPAQTLGRTLPYLYSQNEPIVARSWIPIQDSPAIRMTYDAIVRVPPGFLALMSAENPQETNGSGVYTFRMNESVPAYLIALAAGRLEFRPLDERTGVYAEPELIDDAAWELAYVPEMLDRAEQVLGPYRWGRYDILLMPPGYVAGGMEHPRLNFISPFSAVTGNRPAPVPASTLIAHELGHSWAGDQVTLATWSDTWLNEGLASYLETRLIEDFAPSGRADFNRRNSWQSFSSYAHASTTPPRATLLRRPMNPETDDPSAAFNFAAYTKGGLFFGTLEQALGREEFDAFLRAYFSRFAFRWIDAETFAGFLGDTALAGRPVVEQSLLLREWIYESGLPSNVAHPGPSSYENAIVAEASRFASGESASRLNTQGWSNLETDVFLQAAQGAVLTRMAEVDAAFGLSLRPTPPLTWLRQSVGVWYPPGLQAVERILLRGGPNSWMTNLYLDLSKSSSGRALATSIYSRARERYDPSVQRQIDSILNWENALTASSKRAA